MPSFIALFAFTLSCLSVVSYAANIPREALDKNLKCQNHPFENHPAGDLLLHLNNPDDHHRGKPPVPAPLTTKILCAPGTETFIKLTRKLRSDDLMADTIDRKIQSQIRELVDTTWVSVSKARIRENLEDGVINGDKNTLGVIFSRTGPFGGYKLQVANAHHKKYVPKIHFGAVKIEGHEITWGVLSAALMTVNAFMRDDHYGWTECKFEIWDGRNLVGIARIVRI